MPSKPFTQAGAKVEEKKAGEPAAPVEEPAPAQEKAVAWCGPRWRHITCRAVTPAGWTSTWRSAQGPGGGPAAGAAHQRPGGGGHPGAGGEAFGFPGGKRPQPPVYPGGPASPKNGKPPMESILRKNLLRVTDCKLAQGSLRSAAGRTSPSSTSSSVDGSLEKMAASVEFSQVIECAGASEDCLCDLRVVAGESSLQPGRTTWGSTPAWTSP